ncbi:hypothetical protein ES703_102226 [subsurface metagenome]
MLDGIDCRPKSQRKYNDRLVYGYGLGRVAVTKERGRGTPRSDTERVAEHYGISLDEARRWLTIHPVDMLLPERGEGLNRGTAATLTPRVVYQGVPSGNFIPPYIEVVGHPDNMVPVGEQIKLRAHYRVSCPGQPWYAPAWTIAAKAKGDGIAVKFDHTLYSSGETVSSDLLSRPSYPIMPNKAVTLEVTLWGNPAAWEELPLEDP